MHFSTIFGVIVLSLCFCCSCSNNLEDIKRIKIDAEGDIERAKEVKILYSDSAVVRMRIVAPTMEHIQDNKTPKRTFPDGVLVDFFNVNQQQTSQLTAHYAEYLEKQKQILLRDSIVLWNYRDESLETEELIWSEVDNRIFSKKFVKITTPAEIIHGYGFSSNLEFTEWEIDSVSGIFESNTFIKD